MRVNPKSVFCVPMDVDPIYGGGVWPDDAMDVNLPSQDTQKDDDPMDVNEDEVDENRMLIDDKDIIMT